MAPRGFVGHIGGDDFIFIVPATEISLVCSEILSVFDTLIPLQYSDQDRRAGYFFGKDRRGQLHRVPLMTLSIGIVTNRHRRFTHPAQVSELATEMKSYAKTLPGSVFVVDRRRGDGGRGGRMNVQCPSCSTTVPGRSGQGPGGRRARALLGLRRGVPGVRSSAGGRRAPAAAPRPDPDSAPPPATARAHAAGTARRRHDAPRREPRRARASRRRAG